MCVHTILYRDTLPPVAHILPDSSVHIHVTDSDGGAHECAGPRETVISEICEQILM